MLTNAYMISPELRPMGWDDLDPFLKVCHIFFGFGSYKPLGQLYTPAHTTPIRIGYHKRISFNNGEDRLIWKQIDM
jgi:hypothetical protein